MPVSRLIDYYNYTYVQDPYTPGYDFRQNTDVYYGMKPGTYATDLFTDEALKVIKKHDGTKKPLFMMLNHIAVHSGNSYDLLQAPKDDIAKYSFITDPNRRIYAGKLCNGLTESCYKYFKLQLWCQS